MSKGPKILLVDIETKPLTVLTWNLWPKFISPDMIIDDWGIIAWSAKWLKDDRIHYQDTRRQTEKECLKPLWVLMNEADFVIAHNGDKFDIPKINTRFETLGFKPYSPVKRIDTRKLFKRVFGEVSNSLAYLSEKYNKKYKKLKHAQFPGNDLWKECLTGNRAAWQEMEKYNKHDVLALEELYLRAQPWDSTPFFIYHDEIQCKCGSKEYVRLAKPYCTSTRKYQRYRCNECGFEWRDTKSMRSGGYQGCAR